VEGYRKEGGEVVKKREIKEMANLKGKSGKMKGKEREMEKEENGMKLKKR
jgi:hypothetical protein